MRVHFVVVLIVATSAAEKAADLENNLNIHDQTVIGLTDVVVGKRESGDYLVHTQYFQMPPNPKKRNIAFRPFDVPDDFVITQVRAIDQSNGTGGYCTYEYGGPRMNRVLLGFHSQINQGIHYRIELYGKFYPIN